jgi:hypothetical protein
LPNLKNIPDAIPRKRMKTGKKKRKGELCWKLQPLRPHPIPNDVNGSVRFDLTVIAAPPEEAQTISCSEKQSKNVNAAVSILKRNPQLFAPRKHQSKSIALEHVSSMVPVLPEID